jgi:hypothetical protein
VTNSERELLKGAFRAFIIQKFDEMFEELIEGFEEKFELTDEEREYLKNLSMQGLKK